MAGTMIYRTGISPAWIDYNGHLNDAYYVVVLSLATDAAMERVGIDAAYRASTHGTLYSVEMHMHWRQEVKAEDTLEIDVYVLGVDTKRLHLGYDVRVVGKTEVAATAEDPLDDEDDEELEEEEEGGAGGGEADDDDDDDDGEGDDDGHDNYHDDNHDDDEHDHEY